MIPTASPPGLDLRRSAVLVLICAYGIGAPFLLLRTALSIARRRRLRYRPVDDEVLATSRFTIPVSLLLPIRAEISIPLPSSGGSWPSGIRSWN